MGTASRTRAGIPARDVALAALGYGGGAMSITLMFLGMRAVMDIGGYCAEGGPYEIATHCPDGATPALLLGIFGLFLFGFLATVYGIRVGGIWVAAPLLGWSALFAVLGWNFIEYGVLNAPAETGIDWGWALCGVVFWMMAAGPLVAILPIGAGLLDMPASAIDGRAAAKAAAKPVDLPGPGQPAVVRIITPEGVEIRDAHDPETKAQLEAIDRAMATALAVAAATTPMDPDARERNARAGTIPPPTAAGEEGDEFTEGTQALLDRLERLADMRDRGLLEDAEYETAKEAIVRELEARQ